MAVLCTYLCFLLSSNLNSRCSIIILSFSFLKASPFAFTCSSPAPLSPLSTCRSPHLDHVFQREQESVSSSVPPRVCACVGVCKAAFDIHTLSWRTSQRDGKCRCVSFFPPKKKLSGHSAPRLLSCVHYIHKWSWRWRQGIKTGLERKVTEGERRKGRCGSPGTAAGVWACMCVCVCEAAVFGSPSVSVRLPAARMRGGVKEAEREGEW